MDTQEMSLTFVRKAADIIRLNNWIFDIIHPYIKGRTLELGSANGDMSCLFIEHDLPLHLTDENKIHRENLLKRFEGRHAMRMIHDINFNHPSFDHAYADRAEVFSTVVAVNIAEHGCYEITMVNRAKSLLALGGHFMLVIPAKAVLFNKIDSHLEDLKGYNYKIARNFMGADFEILKVRCFIWSVDPDNRHLNHLYVLAIFRKK